MAEIEAQDEVVDQFLPDDEEALDADEEFADLETAPDDEDVVVEEAPPPPLGRSWAFDFAARAFVTVQGRGPLETRGIDTLKGWIEKCLNTERGAHPVEPDDYGIEGPYDLIGEQLEAFQASDLEERITEALTFHPRITNVADFSSTFDPDHEALFVSFTAVLDDEDELEIEGLRVA